MIFNEFKKREKKRNLPRGQWKQERKEVTLEKGSGINGHATAQHNTVSSKKCRAPPNPLTAPFNRSDLYSPLLFFHMLNRIKEIKSLTLLIDTLELMLLN